ncbi:alpha/beta hydrolase [Francisella sp. Scap27]|uniref:alpha/beta fold hydrolase n=1 Tax=Francisella sp. Scap27 TaxID=2589986 RepID=UPI0015B9F15A|nr:alpha/beta fold hydrolase [Francisella sp. Scap27]QLE79746.1 alpha/beta hydrolase [Francisella sp. Scap27]
MKKTVGVLFLLIIISFGYSIDLKSKVININKNIDIHYYQTSSDEAKPNLIMLTGRGTTTNFWPKDFIDKLSEKYNLYILDYRNINTKNTSSASYAIKDTATDVDKFVKKLNISNPYLLGWSMGGAIAIETVSDYPKDFSHLILLSPALPKTSTQKIPKPPKFKTDDDIYNYVFSINLYNYSKENLDVERNRFINSDIKQLFPSNDVLARQITSVTKWRADDDNLKKFKQIKIPIDIYISLDDKVERVNQIKATITEVKDQKRIKVKYFKNSGHAIAWDRSQKLADNINNL